MARQQRVIRYVLYLMVLSLIGTVSVRADTILLTEDRTVTGVIRQEDAEGLSVTTAEGELRIKRSDIIALEPDTDDENLLLLASFAEARNDPGQAFYLYQRCYETDTASVSAVEGMHRLQEVLFSNAMNTPAAQNTLIGAYQRYWQTGQLPASAEEVLRLNTRDTERLYQTWGMMLSTQQNTIKVVYLAPGSAAAASGIQIDDRFRELDGAHITYLGLYDVIALLLKETPVIPVTVQRYRRIWIGPPLPLVPHFDTLFGCIVTEQDGAFTVIAVDEQSPASRALISPGDRIIEVNGYATARATADEIVSAVARTLPGHVEFFIERNLSLNNPSGRKQ